jgi:DNA-binding CsgD family transcriptional regulator
MTETNLLSRREQEVVKQLMQGKSNKQIALALGISIRTVEFHLKNVYTKYQVSSRIELILHLGNTTVGINEKLGDSTVDLLGKNAENGENSSSCMSWTESIRNAVSTIGKEPEMKKRWTLYPLSGLIFGAAYWHYFSLTAKLFNDISANEHAVSDGVLMILALVAYFCVWLIPAILPAVVEYRRTASLKWSVLSVVTVWVSAVLGYYVNYLVMLAFIGLPNMEFLVVFGERSAAFSQTWQNILPDLILRNLLKWIGVGILAGGVSGLISTSVVSALSRKSGRMLAT